MQFQLWKSGRMSCFRSIASCLLILAGFVLLSGTAQAQVLYGSLTGALTDPSGAAVPGASAEALNVATGVTKQVTTDERGVYLFTVLQPGTYKVTISASGFSSAVAEDVHRESRRDGPHSFRRQHHSRRPD